MNCTILLQCGKLSIRVSRVVCGVYTGLFIFFIHLTFFVLSGLANGRVVLIALQPQVHKAGLVFEVNASSKSAKHNDTKSLASYDLFIPSIRSTYCFESH